MCSKSKSYYTKVKVTSWGRWSSHFLLSSGGHIWHNMKSNFGTYRHYGRRLRNLLSFLFSLTLNLLCLFFLKPLVSLLPSLLGMVLPQTFLPLIYHSNQTQSHHLIWGGEPDWITPPDVMVAPICFAKFWTSGV